MDSIGYLLTKAFYAEVEQNEAMQIGVTAHHHSLYTWICELRNRSTTGEVLDLPIRHTMKMAFIGSDKTLKKCIDDLSDWGIIEILVKGANQYQTTKVKVAVAFLRKHCESNTTAVRQQIKNGVAFLRQQDDSSAIAPRTTKTNKRSKTDKTKNTPDSNESNSETPDVLAFENFWNLYGKKTGSKPNAKALWSKLPIVDRQAIIDRIPEYQRYAKQPTFQKDPERFLKGRIWEGEWPVTTGSGSVSASLHTQTAPAPIPNQPRR